MPPELEFGDRVASSQVVIHLRELTAEIKLSLEANFQQNAKILEGVLRMALAQEQQTSAQATFAADHKAYEGRLRELEDNQNRVNATAYQQECEAERESLRGNAVILSGKVDKINWWIGAIKWGYGTAIAFCGFALTVLLALRKGS